MIWVNSQGSFPKDSQHMILSCFIDTIFLYIGHSSLGSIAIVCEDSIGYISKIVLLTIEKHFNMEIVKRFISSNRAKWFCVCKNILCFKNIKNLNEKHIDCFRYVKVYTDGFMMQYAIYTRITNAFVSMLCWKNKNYSN